METDIHRSVSKIMDRLGEAWNLADGEAFGSVFADDADFVNILGEAFTGQNAISAQHQMIFDTIYKGSCADFRLIKLITLSVGAVIAQIAATVDAPSGPRVGRTKTIATAILRVRGDRWVIVAFQNTLVAPPRIPTS